MKKSIYELDQKERAEYVKANCGLGPYCARCRPTPCLDNSDTETTVQWGLVKPEARKNFDGLICYYEVN